ncbi:MAG: phosphotransferase [Chlorobiales bacterium]|nr:phosphotransferase [Chlorobiales bacterium]
MTNKSPIVLSTIESSLTELFEQWSGEKAEKIAPFPPSGSSREYYRLTGKTKTAIGVYNTDSHENRAFVSFTRHFLKLGFSVPELYQEDLAQNIYLCEDLGDTTLLDYLTECKSNNVFPLEHYQKALDTLAMLQVKGREGLDFSVCYPRQSFDRQSILWDLNYFKYYFLKLSGVPFDEEALETDFHRFANYLLNTDCDFFLYRDFQARNIMVHHDKLYFIDYQGGRKGALQYDVASLLYQAKATIAPELRANLLEHYLDSLSELIPVDRKLFVEHYYGYVLARILQTLGAYGFRGLYERKEHFLESIPFAVHNLRSFLSEVSLRIELPALTKALWFICDLPEFKPASPNETRSSLTVSINSFSYKRGIPADESENGGGFVFDCRALHNPGRYDDYKHLTGRDKEVILFLKKHSAVDEFLHNVYSLVDPSVETYIKRGFTNLMVNFGCTGGQHRSVYCTDMLAKHLTQKYPISVETHHIEQELKGWKNGG